MASTLPFLPLALDPQPAGSHAQFLGIISVTNDIISKLAAVLGLQDYLYKVLDPKPMPEGRSIWIADFKGAC